MVIHAQYYPYMRDSISLYKISTIYAVPYKKYNCEFPGGHIYEYKHVL